MSLVMCKRTGRDCMQKKYLTYLSLTVHKIAVRLPCLQSAKTISYKTNISLTPVENFARTLQ